MFCMKFKDSVIILLFLLVTIRGKEFMISFAGKLATNRLSVFYMHLLT